MVNKVQLRLFPPEEVVRTTGKRAIAVQYRCQFCGGIVRDTYREVQYQICADCRRADLESLFIFDLLPHSRAIQERDDIR